MKLHNLTMIWNDPGPNPTHHRWVKKQLERYWPKLFHALDDILSYSRNGPIIP